MTLGNDSILLQWSWTFIFSGIHDCEREVYMDCLLVNLCHWQICSCNCFVNCKQAFHFWLRYILLELLASSTLPILWSMTTFCYPLLQWLCFFDADNYLKSIILSVIYCIRYGYLFFFMEMIFEIYYAVNNLLQLCLFDEDDIWKLVSFHFFQVGSDGLFCVSMGNLYLFVWLLQ